MAQKTAAKSGGGGGGKGGKGAAAAAIDPEQTPGAVDYGPKGEKLRVWRLEQAHWQQMKQVIERRARKRAGSEQPDESLASPPVASPGSPLSFNQFIVTGDPSQKLELPDWENATEMQQRATELYDCLAQSPERARELLQSWPVEMRVSAIDLLAQSQSEWLEKLIAAVPDLFKWCGE